MEIRIFDVEHGACAAIRPPSGRLMLIDCGHNSTTGWRPSGWLRLSGLMVDDLTITNVDEDHVSDLPQLRPLVRAFSTNWHLTPEWIERAKRASGAGPGVQTLVAMMRASTGPAPPIDWGGMVVERFCHSPVEFDDENGLSLVTFIRFDGIRIVFPGDLTRAAWLGFLRNAAFVAALRQTNIFVASHHGRSDGYCPEIFGPGLCSPQVIVISDKPIVHDTQEVAYGQHAAGILWNQTERRQVLTTRRDGMLTITPQDAAHFYIQASRP